MLYRDDEYVSTIEMPYTSAGTNASIVVGPSADLKVESKLTDYNITEKIKEINSDGRKSHRKRDHRGLDLHLKIESNLDRSAALEVTDTIPQEAVDNLCLARTFRDHGHQLEVETATLTPRQKTAINYSYQVKTTESLDGTN